MILFAGEVAEAYAPLGPHVPDAQAHADSNGGDAIPLAGVATIRAEGPHDDEVVEHFRNLVDDETIERCRALAVEFIERDSVPAINRLETVADALFLHGYLSGDDLEAILA